MQKQVVIMIALVSNLFIYGFQNRFSAISNAFIKIHEYGKLQNLHSLPKDLKAISMLYSETRCGGLGLVTLEIRSLW